MVQLNEIIQKADWKIEKHVPVIDCSDTAERNEFFEVTVGIGKEVAHPNTTEHHISWISLYFHPTGEKFPYQLGHYDFLSHGASTRGPNTSSVYTHHQLTTAFKTNTSGTLLARSLCNIHGLWQSTKEITVT